MEPTNRGDLASQTTAVHNDASASDLDRFHKKYTVAESGCWIWRAASNEDGYGRFHLWGKLWTAHRASFEMFKGNVPAGLDVDHLCRVRACVNPSHLEAITRRENVLRSYRNGQQMRGMRYCSRGHERTPENIYTRPSGVSECAVCKRRTVDCDSCGATVTVSAVAKHRRGCRGRRTT